MSSEITYGTTRVKISVMVDGKKTGEIRNFEGGGYWYVPNGTTEGGEVFRQIAQVKRSLEGAS